ncbi:hypothetical protein [Microcoleus sp. D2_18a_D3]|uniref:hypothetical protein n=1 Tax=Microcoleus sp. D2_18a_D3 TaxID=3055330 RepID=UPI002FD3EA40
MSHWEAMRARARKQLARNPLYRQPGWVAAHARLLALLPDAGEQITAPYAMTPDPILGAATVANVLVESVLLYNPWRSNPAGRGVKSWESYGTLELYDVVFGEHLPTPGPLWFIPDDCFGSREPYSLLGEQLWEFVAGNPCDLHQDVLFIWEQSPRVSLIHHEGGFFHIVVPDRRGVPAKPGAAPDPARI